MMLNLWDLLLCLPLKLFPGSARPETFYRITLILPTQPVVRGFLLANMEPPGCRTMCSVLDWHMWWASNQQTKPFLATDDSRIALFLQPGSQRKPSSALWIRVLNMFSFSSSVVTNKSAGFSGKKKKKSWSNKTRNFKCADSSQSSKHSSVGNCQSMQS